MKSLHRLIVVTSAVATLAAGAGNLQAQDQNQNPGQGRQRGQGGPGGPGGPGAPGGRGNFDPAQFRERMQQMMRERFDVKDDEEWKLISERITKVTEAQRGIRPTGGFGGFPGGRTGGGGPPGGGGGAPGGDQGGRTRGGGGPGGPGGFGGGTPDPDMDALNKAIEAKASPDEIKAKLARVRDARKDKEAKLEAAQEELRQVLSARQEAIAVTMGLLK